MRTILLVDDDEDAGEAFREAMRMSGYRVEIAPNGGAAIERLQISAYDAVVLDLEMPGGNGRELLMRIKADRNLRNLPVIVHTAFPITAQLRYGLQEADAVVEKDGRFDRVSEMLTRLAPASWQDQPQAW